MQVAPMAGCGSASLEDQVFATQVQSCLFPADRFRHADHIRLAWIYLRQAAYGIAEERMRRSIRRLARHAGAANKYHETLTIAWMRLVNAAFHLSSRIDRFADFAGAHGWLLDKEAVFEFYSRARLMSDAARKSWVEPDCKPLPLPTGNERWRPPVHRQVDADTDAVLDPGPQSNQPVPHRRPWASGGSQARRIRVKGASR